MLILASASPRRQELLKLITKNFIIKTADIDENLNITDPKETVLTLAAKKAQAVFAENSKDIVIGSDTVVAVGNQILGKPDSEKGAFRMLMQLSGTTHQVHTGVQIISKDINENFSAVTKVKFMDLTDQMINEYIKTKEPFDKAGAYGIQGFGGKFVEEINGDYFNIVGLPVNQLYKKMKKLQII